MKRFAFALSCVLTMACSTDAIEEENLENGAPGLAAQEFDIDEHSAPGTAIGSVQATANGNAVLTYSLSGSQLVEINESNGALTLAEGAILDFETGGPITFTASVFDGTAIAEAPITVNINDIDELDILDNGQQELLSHFRYLTLFEDPTSPTQDIMRKWDSPMTLFLLGDFPAGAEDVVQEVIEEYNALTDQGDFTISMADSEATATAKLFFGTKEQVETTFPAMYDIVKDLDLDGYASASFVGNFYVSANIWVSRDTKALIKHELGHALGLGHSDRCDSAGPSAMCSTITPGSELLPIEKEAISLFYDKDMPSGLNAAQIDQELSNLILLRE
ncbi:hypothetical protein [Maribacter sp. 2307ULW6-5]|uniref:hypothetical protein n=1 Tax=Maribacter sp. 2307ULW6-5 TaxID=3386275 RepID=UPI0039BD7190